MRDFRDEEPPVVQRAYDRQDDLPICDWCVTHAEQIAAVNAEVERMRPVVEAAELHHDVGDCPLDACHACMAVDTYRKEAR